MDAPALDDSVLEVLVRLVDVLAVLREVLAVELFGQVLRGRAGEDRLDGQLDLAEEVGSEGRPDGGDADGAGDAAGVCKDGIATEDQRRRISSV